MRQISYLAFAVGYRRISFVLIENEELATWQTSCKAARDVVSAARFTAEFIELLRPNVVVMEDFETGTRKGKQALGVLRAIAAILPGHGVQVIKLSREHLHQTRYDEAASLAVRYPELADKVPSRKFFEKEPHHTVLFEAAALAHSAVEGGAMLLASEM